MTLTLVEALDLRPPWYRHAACRGVGADVFHPERGQVAAATAALRWCEACPVRVLCAAEAVRDPTLKGVRGGTTNAERARLRRQWKAGASLEDLLSGPETVSHREAAPNPEPPTRAPERLAERTS